MISIDKIMFSITMHSGIWVGPHMKSLKDMGPKHSREV